MNQPADSLKPGSQWLKNNLVTLGTAAVFSVYAAGYFRTRDAADRFAGETARRHGAALATKGPSVNAIAPPAGVDRDERKHLSPLHKDAAASSPGKEAQQSPDDKSTTAAPPAVAAAVASAPAAASAPTPSAPVDSPAPVAAADSSANAKEKNEDDGRLKDGVFYGWGTSRHGDIQASVEIKNGKIVGAYISQCLTRYSCSWVSMLPGQVVSRQSPEVDYVSGATQSSNAFYYGVVEALKKARGF